MSDSTPEERAGDGTPSPGTNEVSGVFRSRTAATKAVRRLTQNGVPTNTIDVFVLNRDGDRGRRVRVNTEFGALRGGLIGAGLGAVVGVLIVLLAGTGLLGPVDVDPLGLRGLTGAVRAIAMAAVAGVPLGVLIGMGHWSGRKKITATEAENGVMVVVDSETAAHAAREILEELEAERISPAAEGSIGSRGG